MFNLLDHLQIFSISLLECNSELLHQSTNTPVFSSFFSIVKIGVFKFLDNNFAGFTSFEKMHQGSS